MSYKVEIASSKDAGLKKSKSRDLEITEFFDKLTKGVTSENYIASQNIQDPKFSYIFFSDDAESKFEIDVTFSIEQFKNFLFNKLQGSIQQNRAGMFRFSNCKLSNLRIDHDFCTRLEIDNCEISSLVITHDVEVRIANSTVIDSLKIIRNEKFEDFSNALIIERSVIKNFRIRAKFNKSVEFCKTIFGIENTECGVDFSSSKFDQRLFFDNCIFYRAPLFANVRLDEILFLDTKFLDVTNLDAVERWSIIKQLLQSRHFDAQAQELHAAELDAKRRRMKFLSRSFWEKLSSYVLFYISDYGRNLLLPLRALSVLFLLGGFLYYFVDEVNCNFGALNTTAIWLQNVCFCDGKLYKASVYSGLQTLGPLGIIYADHAFGPVTVTGKLVSFFHFLFSSLIWFVWALQTRAKFKL